MLAYIMELPNMSFDRERRTKKNVDKYIYIYICVYIGFHVAHKTSVSRNLLTKRLLSAGSALDALRDKHTHLLV